MKLALRALLLVGVFVGTALVTYRGVLLKAPVRDGAYAPETKLAAEMAGLFGGGLAVAVVGVVMVWARGRGK